MFMRWIIRGAKHILHRGRIEAPCFLRKLEFAQAAVP